MVQKLIDKYCRLLSWLMVVSLAIMVVLVFSNVVLRYTLNSGIAVSEELSRWLFVWLTFLGAIVALRDHAHLGTDMLVAHLPPLGKKLCLGIGYVLMLFICWLIFEGALAQVKINMESTSAAMEISMSYFYGCGLVFAASGGVILLNDLWRLVTGQVAPAEIDSIRETLDMPHGNPHL